MSLRGMRWTTREKMLDMEAVGIIEILQPPAKDITFMMPLLSDCIFYKFYHNVISTNC